MCHWTAAIYRCEHYCLRCNDCIYDRLSDCLGLVSLKFVFPNRETFLSRCDVCDPKVEREAIYAPVLVSRRPNREEGALSDASMMMECFKRAKAGNPSRDKDGGESPPPA